LTRPVALGGESCRRALSSAPGGLTSARNRTDGLGKILATQVVKGVLCAARDVKRNFGALRAIAIAAAARYPRHRRRKPLQRADWTTGRQPRTPSRTCVAQAAVGPALTVIAVRPASNPPPRSNGRSCQRHRSTLRRHPQRLNRSPRALGIHPRHQPRLHQALRLA